jgi:F-box protein 9
MVRFVSQLIEPAIALANYRKAFKMDRNIDYKYKQHYQTHIAPSITAEATTNIPSQTPGEIEESENDNFHHVVQFGREYIAPNIFSHSPIDDLVENFKNQSLEYIPADEEKPVLISILPSKWYDYRRFCMVIGRVTHRRTI